MTIEREPCYEDDIRNRDIKIGLLEERVRLLEKRCRLYSRAIRAANKIISVNTERLRLLWKS